MFLLFPYCMSERARAGGGGFGKPSSRGVRQKGCQQAQKSDFRKTVLFVQPAKNRVLLLFRPPRRTLRTLSAYATAAEMLGRTRIPVVR